MDFIEQIIALISGLDSSLSWGIMSALISYLIYNQHLIRKDMQDKWNDILNLIKENRHSHAETKEQLQQLRQAVKDDLLPILRQMERDLQKLDDLARVMEEGKTDQRGWFASVRDDMNQFRSEFRDILKLVMNGRKNDCK